MLTQTHLQQLQLLWQQGEQFDASHSERREKRLNITPDTGKFLYQGFVAQIRACACPVE